MMNYDTRDLNLRIHLFLGLDTDIRVELHGAFPYTHISVHQGFHRIKRYSAKQLNQTGLSYIPSDVLKFHIIYDAICFPDPITIEL